MAAAAILAVSVCACDVLVDISPIVFADASSEAGDAEADGGGGADTGSPGADTGTKDSGSPADGASKDAPVPDAHDGGGEAG